MNIPNKVYKESKGEILEYDFIKTVHNKEEDELEIHYSLNKTFYITHYSEYTEVSDEYLYKLFYFEDLWLNKEDLIKYKIESYNKSIEYFKKKIEAYNKHLNKLLQL